MASRLKLVPALVQMACRLKLVPALVPIAFGLNPLVNRFHQLEPTAQPTVSESSESEKAATFEAQLRMRPVGKWGKCIAPLSSTYLTEWNKNL
jgi:hypothetical protein